MAIWCLVDTNVLLRSTRRSDPHYQTIEKALLQLITRGVFLCYTHQNIAELWNAMTRPKSSNGLGLTVIEADKEVRSIESGMTLLPDSAAVYREWRQIVFRYRVSGVQVHDARLAAAMYVHGVSHILTMNEADFQRFSGIMIVHPSRVSSFIQP